MTDAPALPTAEESTSEKQSSAPAVRVIVTMIDGADLNAALATVDRQAYDEVDGVSVVGTGEELPENVEGAESLEAAIAGAGSDIEYLWILHSDARPRPDALAALVSELERNEASLGGSKLLVAGSSDELESIGSATDIFGEPHSGLDEGEIDLQQYDVVREAAFVSSVSMLVRRDLAQGLGGLDDRLQPGAAGLDFSQRVRLAGGRVLTVPSSEVYHQGRCADRDKGWREQAGRMRAMLKAYSLLTLAWVLPYGLLMAIMDSLANLLFLRWRPLASHIAAVGWNLFHLPSTIAARRRFRPVRAVGDEELFRFQSRGSVHLRDIGSELTDRILSVFDEDQALARGNRRVWSSPGIWGAVLAAGLALFATRAIFFTGVPNVGFSFPFEPPTVAFSRFFGGWNQSSLGSPAAVHPSSAFSGLASFLWFGTEGAARTLATLGFAILAVVGMGRLAGRLGFRGPGRYLSGVVLLAGPGTAALTGAGSWLALGGAALLPWAVRAVFLHSSDLAKGRWVHLGLVVFWSFLLASLSPLLALVPPLAGLVWFGVGGRNTRWWLALVSISSALVAAGFLLGDPGWATDSGRRLGLSSSDLWPVLVGLTALPVVFIGNPVRRLALFGALFGLGGIALVKLPWGGPGFEEAALILASFGAAVVVAASLDVITREPIRLLAALTGVAVLALSLSPLVGGRLGLPEGDQNDRFGFASALADEGGAGRILSISVEQSLVAGEDRPGPGFWYRVMDGEGMTLDQVWLPEPLEGDDDLEVAIRHIATGAELRPGALLGPLAIDWLVIDGPESTLDEILMSQLDLVPTPLSPESRVYENPASVPLAAAGSDLIWVRDGTGFAGPESGSSRVRIAINHDSGWSPGPGQVEWAASVAATDGAATFRNGGFSLYLPIAAAALFLMGLVAMLVGRFRK